MDSRGRILETATRLFARQGFASVSLRAIAERVGMTKPSLLYHFPSKDRLREEVLGEVFEHWTTRLPNLLRAVTTGSGQFEALMDELTAFFREDADRAHLLLRELLDRPEEMRTRVATSLRPLVTLVAGAVRKGQSAGILRRDVDPEAFVLHMIGSTIATVVALPLVEPILATGGERAMQRQERELRRMAYTSLFSSPPGTSTDSPAKKARAHAER